MKKFGRAGSTFGTVVAAALVLSVATTGGAVAGGLITSKQIKNNTIKSIDVRDANLTGVDVKDGSLLAQDLSSDAQRSFTGINGYTLVTADSASVADGGSGFQRAVCPAGLRLTGGGAAWANGSDSGSFLGRSNPESFNNGSSAAPTSATANSWFADGENHSGGTRVLRVYAFCASVN